MTKMFNYELSNELKEIMKKLFKKNRTKYEQILKKIDEIVSLDSETINHYKNLRYDLSNQKRVHIGENFVLTFEVDTKNNFILFINFEHRDSVYK